MRRYKSKRNFFIGVLIILLIAALEYYLINKYVGKEVTGVVVEQRVLNNNEEELFRNIFKENKGFIENFYDDISYLTIPEILEKEQGINNRVFLEEKTKSEISENEITLIVDGEILRSIYKQKTNYPYKSKERNINFKYNEKYDVYYSEEEITKEINPNYYEFIELTIYSNNVYDIKYIAYEIISDNSLYIGHDDEIKEELYTGLVSLKRIGGNYYFISNKVIDHQIYFHKIEQYVNTFDFYQNIEEKETMLGTNYYDDAYKVRINKYGNLENSDYAILVAPFTDEVNEETYYFTDDDLKLYTISNKNGEITYYYFINNEVTIKYKTQAGEITHFEAFTEEIKENTEMILNRSIIIK